MANFVKIASLGVTLLVLTILSAQLIGVRAEELGENRNNGSPTESEPRHTETSERMREGTKVQDVLGKFEIIGDRISFYPQDAEEPLRALENLALERVARQLSGLSRQRLWRVSGVVTEFQGGNYLLVERAILKATSDR